MLQSAAIYASSNIINAVIPFLLLPILTRVLLPADYGLLSMFAASLGILGAFTGLTVHGAVNVRFVDRPKMDFPRYVGSCFLVLLISTTLTFVVVGIFVRPFSDFTELPPFWLYVAVLVSSCNFIVQIRLGIWMMQKKPFAYSLYQMLLSALNLGFSLTLVLLLRQGYEGRLWGQTIAVVAFAFFGFFSLLRGGWVKLRPRKDYMREVLAYGIPLMPHVIGGFLASLADRFVINQQLGLAAAGVYMVAAQFGMGLGLLADAFNKAFTPWIYEHLAMNELAVKRKIVRGTWIYCIAALVLAGVLALLARQIVVLVAGPGYAEAAQALPWLALGQAFGGMYFMVASHIFFARKTRLLAWITLFTGVTGVALTYMLIPFCGIAGAGISFAIAMFLRFVLTWMLAQRVSPMPWFSFRVKPSVGV